MRFEILADDGEVLEVMDSEEVKELRQLLEMEKEVASATNNNRLMQMVERTKQPIDHAAELEDEQ